MAPSHQDSDTLLLNQVVRQPGKYDQLCLSLASLVCKLFGSCGRRTLSTLTSIDVTSVHETSLMSTVYTRRHLYQQCTLDVTDVNSVH